MKELTVFYDSSLKDAERDLYIKSIEKNIPTANLIDLSKGGFYKNYSFKRDRILAVKPLTNDITELMQRTFAQGNWLDIEGTYTDGLPITAESILSVLDTDLSGKKVVVINQSDTIGKPLVQELIKRRANVMSFNSSLYRLDIEYILLCTKPDILITASGDKDFVLKDECLAYIDTIIDLSNDTRVKRARRYIPTTKILKKRLED